MAKRKAEELSESTAASAKLYFRLRYKAGQIKRPEIDLEVSSPGLVASPEFTGLKVCPPNFIENLLKLVKENDILACDSRGWPSPTYLTQELFVQLGDACFECKTCKTGTASCTLQEMRQFEGLDVLHKLGGDIRQLLHDFDPSFNDDESWLDWEDAQKHAYVVTLLASDKSNSEGKNFVEAVSLGDSFDIELDGYDTIATIASKIHGAKKLSLAAQVHLLTLDGEQLTEEKLCEMRPKAKFVPVDTQSDRLPMEMRAQIRAAQRRYIDAHALALTNDAPDRDAQPDAGIDAALGSAFTTAGRANCG